MFGWSRERPVPWVMQTAQADCGAACLAMVLAYHGKELSLDNIRDRVFLGRDGSNAKLLIEAGRAFGLRGRGFTVPAIEDLHHLPRASILHWAFSHFVVLESVNSAGATVVDPASGRRQVPLDELKRSFTGVALTFEPDENFAPEKRSRGAIWKRYLSELGRKSGVLGKVVVISLLVQILALALPVLTGLVVDRVVPRADYPLLQVLAFGFVGVIGFRFVASLVRSLLLLKLRTELDSKITLEFLDHLVDLPYAFFQTRSSGDLILRLNSNSTVREILTSGALSSVLDGLFVIFYLALLLFASPQLGALVLGLGALRIGLFVLTKKKHRDLMSASLQTQAKSRNYQVQMLAGIETLKVAGAEKRAVELWSGLFVDELNVSVERGRLSAWYDGVLEALSTASPLVILLFGAVQVLSGELTLGTMLALNALAIGFLSPLSALVSTAFQFQLLRSYLERIEDVLETEREQDPATVRPAPRLTGRVELQDVSFRYGTSSPLVIRDVSLAVEAGSFVALVGKSGAGKTTLANLMVGLYAPTAGRVLLDGLDLATLDLRSVRSQLGIVSQAPFLFGRSIRENISLADPNLTLPEIERAARMAQVHDEIKEMGMGYETPLADGGASLSGGQRQRIALARAIAHQPALLLLDEATSNLDAIAERAIHAELAEMRATRVVIAHRLSTVKAADQILVVHGGRVNERGTYRELLELGGHFAELATAQLTGPEGERGHFLGSG